jgi:hypothetical protein
MLMHFQVNLVTEGFLAYKAIARQLSTMHTPMSFEATLSTEGLIAHIAKFWLLSV